jgi:hypothetical protein
VVYYRACAFRNAVQRRFVASMIARRPAALSLRFVRVRERSSLLSGLGPSLPLSGGNSGASRSRHPTFVGAPHATAETVCKETGGRK